MMLSQQVTFYKSILIFDIITLSPVLYFGSSSLTRVNICYIDSSKEVDDKNPKFKIEDNVIISNYKNTFAEGYTSNWSEEIFAIEKVKYTVPWRYVINDLKEEEIIGTF